MKTCQRKWVVAMTLMVGALSVEASVISKDNNTDALNLGSSWVGGVAPGPGDVATWDAALTASKTYSLGADLSWLGLAFSADPGGNVTVNPGYTLTLGSAGIYVVPNRTVTLNSGMVLSADQPWYVGAATFVQAGAMNMGGYTLTLSGSPTKQFKGLITGGGRLVNNGAGAIKFTNAGTAAPTTDVELNADNLTFETATGLAAGPRTKSIRLNAGSMNIGGISSANTVETNANALTVGPGTSTVTITPNAAKNAAFYSGSLVRANGSGMINFRGVGLGTNTLASLTPNSANMVFGTPPAMLGAGGGVGSTTNSIVPGVVADTSATGSGLGLTTYDDSYGLRLVNTNTECTAAISDGQVQRDNVLLANSAGAGIVSSELTTPTTINSLSFGVFGPNTVLGSGITIAGNTTLTLGSGCIYANQNVTSQPSSGNTSNAMTIGVETLDLNGREGVFIAYTSTLNSSGQPSGGLLDLRCAITNDGGNGVTILGPGTTRFAGSGTNTYTGTTTVNSGRLWLMKSSATGVPGTLVINGGRVEDQSNQIADSSDITINAGLFTLQIGNEGQSRSETFNNLFMNGGGYNCGSADHYGGSLISGTAVLAGGSMSLPRQTVVTVAGSLVLAGGTISVSRSQSTTLSTYNTVVTANGGLIISNLASGAYTPITLGAGDATHSGAKLSLNGGDVTFVGNAENSNTVTIDAPAGTGTAGVISLTGSRTFDIGDGAAEYDLTLVPILVNNVSAGSLVKTGAGTLVLAATNAYTGATAVSNGTLVVNGSVVSPVTVSSDAVLTGTGVVNVASGTALTVVTGGIVDPGAADAVGALTVTGDVSFANSSIYRVKVAAANADRLTVSGVVSGGPVAVEVVGGAVTAPVLIMSATSGISASFTTATSGLVVGKRADGTELWLVKNQGTLIRVQ